MYDELVKALRENAEWADGNIWEVPIMLPDNLKQATDAIEELQKRVELEYQSGFADGQRAANRKKNKWIGVDEPPKDDRNIFICHGSADFKAPCIGHYDPGMKLFYEDKNWFASPIYDAMFWCEMPKLPLPEPPEVKK